MFTVWYICTPVACDSRYTPRPVTVLSRELSIIIIILPALFPFRKMVLFYRLLLLYISTALLPSA